MPSEDVLSGLGLDHQLGWCPGPDLNRHALNEREILSLLCLPISPPGQRGRSERREGYHAHCLAKAPLAASSPKFHSTAHMLLGTISDGTKSTIWGTLWQ